MKTLATLFLLIVSNVTAQTMTVRGLKKLGTVKAEREGSLEFTFAESKNRNGELINQQVMVVFWQMDRAKGQGIIQGTDLLGLIEAIDYMAAIKKSPARYETYDVSYRVKGGFAITLGNEDRPATDLTIVSAEPTSPYLALLTCEISKLAELRAIFFKALQETEAI